MTSADLENSSIQRDQDTHWFRFGIKSLVFATALVAVYLGGRASMRPSSSVPQAGTWRLILPAGYERPVKLLALPDNRYLLNWGANSNLGGKYRWKAGKLTVEVPNDQRFVGLAWQWVGDDLVLVAEPPGRPAGPTYLGARLQFVSTDTSEATMGSVQVVEPSRAPQRRTSPSRIDDSRTRVTR
jgi:hypothetical protein